MEWDPLRATLAMGGPIYVPRGRAFRRWYVSGWGGKPEPRPSVNRLLVDAEHRDTGSSIRVETWCDDPRIPEHWMAEELALHVGLPATEGAYVEISDHALSIRMDRGRAASLHVMEAEGEVLAFGRVGERWVRLWASGEVIGDLTLRTIADPADLEPSRWQSRPVQAD